MGRIKKYSRPSQLKKKHKNKRLRQRKSSYDFNEEDIAEKPEAQQN